VSSMGALIFFAILGAVICAKAHSPGGTAVFSLIALGLFVSTPAGDGLPGLLADFVTSVSEAAEPFMGGSEAVG
jgi:hypothetical protein